MLPQWAPLYLCLSKLSTWYTYINRIPIIHILGKWEIIKFWVLSWYGIRAYCLIALWINFVFHMVFSFAIVLIKKKVLASVANQLLHLQNHPYTFSTCIAVVTIPATLSTSVVAIPALLSLSPSNFCLIYHWFWSVWICSTTHFDLKPYFSPLLFFLIHSPSLPWFLNQNPLSHHKILQSLLLSLFYKNRVPRNYAISGHFGTQYP